MKIALVTGSTYGLGYEVAEKLLLQNQFVIFTGRSRDKLENIKLRFQGMEKNFSTYCVDFNNHSQLSWFIGELNEKFSGIDIVVHNLGGKVDSDSHPLTYKVLEQSIRLNLGIAADLNAAILEKMLEKKAGRIIHISSDAGLTGISAPGYAAAKSAVNAYVKSTARYYAKYNIMICAVLPGIFEHENSAWTIKKKEMPDYYNQKIAQMPLGRFLFSHEICDEIVAIALSSSIAYTGSLVELTGAFH